METRLAIATAKQAWQARATALGYTKGKRVDSAALEFICGYASASQADLSSLAQLTAIRGAIQLQLNSLDREALGI